MDDNIINKSPKRVVLLPSSTIKQQRNDIIKNYNNQLNESTGVFYAGRMQYLKHKQEDFEEDSLYMTTARRKKKKKKKQNYLKPPHLFMTKNQAQVDYNMNYNKKQIYNKIDKTKFKTLQLPELKEINNQFTKKFWNFYDSKETPRTNRSYSDISKYNNNNDNNNNIQLNNNNNEINNHNHTNHEDINFNSLNINNLRNNNTNNSSIINFLNDFEQNSSQIINREESKNSINSSRRKKKKKRIKERYWYKKHEAGCTFWVNKKTGVIMETIDDIKNTPVLLKRKIQTFEDIFIDSENNNNNNNNNSDDDIIPTNMGTGYLVYNQGDVNDVLNILENEKKS